MGIIIITLIIGVIGILIHTHYVKIDTYEIKDKGVNLRIAHISDIHDQLTYANGRLSEILNRYKLDYLIVTGDLSERSSNLGKVIEELGRVEVAKCIYIVLGNYEREERIGMKKKKLNITNEGYHQLNTDKLKILMNEYEIVNDIEHGKKILFYGFDNSIYGNEGYSKDLMNKHFDLKIMFAHSPHIIQYMESQSIAYDLLLVGHTHGNQVNVPFLNTIRNNYKAFHIGCKIDEEKIFNISRGLGTSRLPIRINSAPQITIFEIH